MSHFKHISGKFSDVLERLGLSNASYISEEPTIEQIKDDLHRNKYINPKAPVKGLQDRILSNYKKDNNSTNFRQGNWSGRRLINLFLAEYYEEKYMNQKQAYRDLEVYFCYQDDTGKICGLAITYLDLNLDDTNNYTEHPDEFKESDEQPIFYPLITSIRDVTEAPDVCEVSIFIHEKLWPDKLEKDSKENGLNHEEFTETLNETLNSSFIKQIIDGVIDEDNLISLTHFKSLKQRFYHLTIDDRDVRKALLGEILDYARDSHQDIKLLSAFDKLEEQSKYDVEFFLYSKFIETLKEFFKTSDENKTNQMQLLHYSTRIGLYVSEYLRGSHDDYYLKAGLEKLKELTLQAYKEENFQNPSDILSPNNTVGLHQINQAIHARIMELNPTVKSQNDKYRLTFWQRHKTNLLVGTPLLGLSIYTGVIIASAPLGLAFLSEIFLVATAIELIMLVGLIKIVWDITHIEYEVSNSNQYCNSLIRKTLVSIYEVIEDIQNDIGSNNTSEDNPKPSGPPQLR